MKFPKQIFQITILNLEFEFPAHNSKQRIKLSDKKPPLLCNRMEKSYKMQQSTLLFHKKRNTTFLFVELGTSDGGASRIPSRKASMQARYHSRFFVQVGHKTTYAAIGNHCFFTKTCHRLYRCP